MKRPGTQLFHRWPMTIDKAEALEEIDATLHNLPLTEEGITRCRVGHIGREAEFVVLPRL
jgi:hypothetical protein